MFARNLRSRFEFESISANFRETSMEKRAFLKLLCIGAGMVAAGGARGGSHFIHAARRAEP